MTIDKDGFQVTGFQCPVCDRPIRSIALHALGAHPDCCCWSCGRPLTPTDYLAQRHIHELCAVEDRAGQLVD